MIPFCHLGYRAHWKHSSSCAVSEKNKPLCVLPNSSPLTSGGRGSRLNSAIAGTTEAEIRLVPKETLMFTSLESGLSSGSKKIEL